MTILRFGYKRADTGKDDRSVDRFGRDDNSSLACKGNDDGKAHRVRFEMTGFCWWSENGGSE